MVFNVGEIATYGAGAAFLAHWLTNGFTLLLPARASWLAFLVSTILSIVLVAVLTVANAPEGIAFTAKLWANIVIVGLLGAAGAGGASVTQASATAKRDQTVHQPEPDVSSPRPEVTG